MIYKFISALSKSDNDHIHSFFHDAKFSASSQPFISSDRRRKGSFKICCVVVLVQIDLIISHRTELQLGLPYRLCQERLRLFREAVLGDLLFVLILSQPW